MIRERNIASFTYSAGNSQIVDLPRDAVYHILQLSVTGYLVILQPTTGTQVLFDDCFPFSILKNIRLIRNGSDVVYQSSGCLLAKEHYYLNETFPHARLYTLATSVETLLLSSTVGALGAKGVTVPANDEGIGMTQVEFCTATNAAAATNTVNFDFQVDLYLQMGPSDLYFGSLVDARRLATFQLAFDYAAVTDVTIPGSGASSTIVANGRVLSYDQDNVAVDVDYGTFKRSQLSISNLAYGSSNQQILLTRGNYYHGIIMDCLAQKSNSTTVLAHENGVIDTMINRINTNFQLRQTDWEDLQRKTVADGCANNAFSGSRGLPNGTAYIYFPCTGDRASELVPSHAFDQFDLLINVAPSTSTAAPSNGISGPENGATTSGTNPTINILLEEVIPGVSMGASYPTAAQAGSRRATSAKPYAR